MRSLKQGDSIRKYVKEFQELKFKIPRMPDSEALDMFVGGLQDWAQMEVDRREVETLVDAIRVAESLADYKGDKLKSSNHQDGDSKGGGEKAKFGSYTSSTKSSDAKLGKGGKGDDNKPWECFLCKGPHSVRMAPLERLGAIDAAAKPSKKGRMFVRVQVGGTELDALVDTGATHNFLQAKTARELGIRYMPQESTTTMKTVNLEAQPIVGLAYDMKVRIGNWCGRLEFTVVELDDYPMPRCVLSTMRESTLGAISAAKMALETGQTSVAKPNEAEVKAIPKEDEVPMDRQPPRMWIKAHRVVRCTEDAVVFEYLVKWRDQPEARWVHEDKLNRFGRQVASYLRKAMRALPE
ncbi:hypothetical protein Tsubulata_014177 [Turnera subulata]|uniref:Chromo domain-containing protein n=1 Tax=Turnera subulata TaxID=218843 RepID=A0A9Q0J5V8_9ROSI|nr:hypothetical protein Tsubulata_014177 [Turnera subulata]